MNTEDTLTSLAPTLKNLLSERQMSAADLSRQSGLSMASLSRILAGQVSPSFESVWKIAKALNISLSSLMPESDIIAGASQTPQIKPEADLAAVFWLEDTDLTPASAQTLLTRAAMGSWVPSSTEKWVDDSLPRPQITQSRQIGTKRLELHLAWPNMVVEGGSIAGTLSVVGSALTGTGARLVDIRIPETLIRTFPGPAFGIRGLRDTFNKHGRPLIACTIRPMSGLSPRQYGRAIYEALTGGSDLTADPTMLHSIQGNTWRERFRFAAEATHAATQETNEYKTHAVNITAATVEDMLERALWAKELDMALLMLDTAAVGWSAFQSVATWCRRNDMLLAAMGGRVLDNMLSEQMQAKLLRLGGADMVSTGSPLRGNVSNRRYVTGVLNTLRDDILTGEHDIGHALPQTFAGLEASCPAVGGGHNPWHFPRLIDAMGPHMVIQCGGSIMGHPMGTKAGATAARTAVEAIMQASGEGQNLNVEGRNILTRAAKYSPELKMALDHWQEGSFLFGVVSNMATKPTDATITSIKGGEVTNITAFRKPEDKSPENDPSED